jgi:hypothetical protein
MRAVKMKSALIKSALAASVLLLAGGAYAAVQQVNLTAGPTATILTDGTSVPMWGYSCGIVVSGSTATCAASNPGAVATPASTAGAAVMNGWSPVVITVPAGQDLQINLTNNLSFTTTTATTNTVPTSLVILGQLGGGLGAGGKYVASPTHAPYGNTWFTAGTTAGATFNPPAQGSRVQSFGTEVGPGTTTSLTWTAPKAGTYLIESGTHPSIQVPMGLYGMVVVTQAPTTVTNGTVTRETAAGCAYPVTGQACASAATYDTDVDLLMSEIDPLQNNSVQTAVTTAGFSETSARILRDTLAAVNVAAGGSGYTAGTPIVFGPGCVVAPTAQIDTVDGTGAILTVAVLTPGSGCSMIPSAAPAAGAGTNASLTAALALSGVMCSDGAGACYPPAVNYTPTYFLFNGRGFDKTTAANSVFAGSPNILAKNGGKVLVRFANAGLRMHVPSLVNTVTGDPGATPAIPLAPGFTLIAEDGNPVPPAAPRVQSVVFTPAGKTMDVMYTQTSGLSLALTGGGAGYGPNPPSQTAVVNISGGGATTPATATATIGWALQGISVGNGGSGYTLADQGAAVTIPAPIGTGTQATATAAMAFSVGSLTITNPGTCYAVGETFTVTDGTATATGHITSVDGTCAVSGYGAITGVTIDTNSSAFTAQPNAVAVTGANDTTATLTATLSGTVTGINVTNFGSGYTTVPTATVPSTNTGATLATLNTSLNPASGAIVAVSVGVGQSGSGYTEAPAVTITDSALTALGQSAATPASVLATLMPSGITPVYDRELSLSGNAINRDSGMLGYISIGGAQLPTGANAIAALTAAVAVKDAYPSVLAGQTLTVSDPSKGVLANDTNVFGAKIVAVNGTALATPTNGAVVATNGTLTLNPNGTFTYAATTAGGDTFTYCGNGATSGNACATLTLSAATLEAGSAVHAVADSYTSTVSTTLTIKAPGVLANDSDDKHYPLTVAKATIAAPWTGNMKLNGNNAASSSFTMYPDGSFTATASMPGTYTFTYQAQNSQGVMSGSATVTVTFPAASNLAVTVLDPTTGGAITDYRWIIEEDRTFYVDPKCTQNPLPATCPTVTAQGAPFGFGTNFHTSHMPVVAAGCTGALSCESGQTLQGVPAVCDIGNGICRTPSSVADAQEKPLDPKTVNLDPTKRYYISILPGDAANPFQAGYLQAPCAYDTTNTQPCVGHGMGGTAIPAPCPPKTVQASCTAGFAPVTVVTTPTPFPTAKLSVFVYEDDFPLDGQFSPGGGVDVLAPNEPGLGGFEILLFDAGGGPGDATGQITYDMFNQPLSNALAGTIDPVTGKDACPLSPVISQDALSGTPTAGAQKGVTGMIVTCPKYESDGVTLSPLAGQAVIPNLPQARYSVVANPSADRIAAGEEWLQTNTLDGQKGHDAFARVGEPAYFQEFGPSGFHTSIGFANPVLINNRRHNDQGTGMCDPTSSGGGGLDCTNSVTGHVTGSRLSRAPDERIYGSRTRKSLSFTQCYVSLGDPDGFDFAFAKCDADGNFTFPNVPAGNWKITTFDQWNDQIIDGITTPVALNCSGVTAAGVCPSNNGGKNLNMGEIAVHQWQANIYTRTFLDLNGNGISDKDANGNDIEPGLPLESTNNRWRDGSTSNFNNTDLNGYANYNEVFPLFNWYVVEGYTTRYKTTGVHVVMDAGGPVDVDPTQAGTLCNTAPDANGNATNGDRVCGASNIAANMANTYDFNPLPADIGFPGSIYCGLTATADCIGKSINTQFATGISQSDASPASGCHVDPTTGMGMVCPAISTGRIDPPTWFGSYGWQGFIGQNQWLEFGKRPYAPGETGGIRGHVIYGSTRPFDNPQLLLQNQWEPLIPGVTVNLYKEDVDPSDGVTPILTLVDTTKTSSFDDWVQGFRSDGKPNISCPGQTVNDPLFFALANQPTYLDWYNNVLHGTKTAATALPYNSQFKCYDGMHSWNQLQPAPYDGLYVFPSVTSIDPTTGRPNGTNCTACVTNVDAGDSFRYGGSTTAQPFVSGTSQGTPVLPAGKYVVEVIVPPGYELVKEEDKNILIGDNYIAPATVQFSGLGGSIFIMPDQAQLAASFNPNNPQNMTNSLGRFSNLPSHEGDTGTVEAYWPCVGAVRQVPDYLSLFPNAHQVSPFAGAFRNLCDRKEVLLTDQSTALAKFYIFSSTHIAAHFTGVILDDFTGEFDPFSPQFGEKFAPAYLPVSVKDWAGNESNRVYSDEFGLYNGLNYSTWEVDPPNPTGYGPMMMVMCMNDSGNATKSPWWDTAAAGTVSANPDPFFQPNYSQFCYELAFMPGQTGYFDTPVIPTSSFAEGYNHPDCNYPDATPAIKEVDGDGIGPWVSAGGTGHTLKIYALGDQMVDNYGYSGPNATVSPFNQQKIKRHYGFGATAGSVTLIDPSGASHNLTGVSWSDGLITGTVPTWTCNSSGTNCPLAQQSTFAPGASQIQSAQLVIKAANGRTAVDTVTVWIGGKAPTHVAASGTIQAAIDAAAPGDLIIVDPTCNATVAGVLSMVDCTTAGATHTTVAHNEMIQMYKPVRLQGVGAASSIIDANTQPAGKLLDPWRVRINCLVGLTTDGRPRTAGDNSCAAGWAYANGGPDYPTIIVDRLPFEAMLGWDASLNGNLVEQLIEPSLMGAYEGAAITVLAKGVKIPAPATLSADPQTAVLEAFGAGTTNTGAAFPANTNLLMPADCGTASAPNTTYPTSFYCNPSSIDGLGIHNSSQGGGGIFVHAYAHNLQIANNRVSNNEGTTGGGITVGLGEHADAQQVGAAPTQFPGSCDTTTTAPAGMLLPYCYNVNVKVHHNSVTMNSSTGDELFSSTPAGAGGVAFMTGDDNYQFNNNWVCGNLAVGDGGGVSHIGFSNNATIANNTIIFNQSTNPSITTNGGGLLLMGAPDADPTTCGVTTDIDCVPAPGSISPSDGIGRNVKVNANLILGNAADSGSGGGLRLQHVNGMDVVDLPLGATVCTQPAGATAKACAWNSATVTNNIIANNVAGWDGAGVSLQDTLVANIVNNTIVSNDTTASSGTLLNSLFAASASSAGSASGGITGGNSGNVICGTGQSCPQVAGVVSVTNSPVLMANLSSTVAAGGLTCPPGHGVNVAATGTSSGTVPSCFYYSVPLLTNDVIWQNHAYYIGVGGPGSGAANKQNVVTLYNAFTGTVAASQSKTPATASNGTGQIVTGGTGACVGTSSTWEIGVRGDTGPSNHGTYNDPTYSASVSLRLSPTYSVLTDAATDYAGANNLATDPQLASFYCNGSRTPPENGGQGWAVPPGTIESNALPAPIFTLTPSAVVDEGNNWVNLRWGPLALTDPATGAMLGNFNLTSGSPAINAGVSVAVNGVTPPAQDFFGRNRAAPYDIGAVEYAANTVSTLTVSCGGSTTTPCAGLTFTTAIGTTSAAQTLTLANATGGATADLYGVGFTGPFSRSGGTCGITLNAGATCTITVVFTPTAIGPATGDASVNANFPVNGSPVPLTGTGVALPTLTSITPSSWTRGITQSVHFVGTNLTGASAINISTPGTGTAAITCAITTAQTTATDVYANCTVGSTASLTTSHNVSVTATNGTSNTLAVTIVNPAAATVTGISPNFGVRSQAVAVTISGTNFTTTGTTVAVGGGVTPSAVTVTSATTITATFTISATAGFGAHAVTVTTPAGAATANPAGANTFYVGPYLTSITPASGERGTTVPVLATGYGLTGATAMSISGGTTCTGVSSTNPSATGTSTVTASCPIPAGAGTGGHTVTVTNGGVISNTVAFTVTGATLTISAPTPSMTTSTGNLTPKAAVITVTNATTATGPFTFTAAPTISAGANGTFSITGGSCANGTVLSNAAGSNTCTISVRYAPTNITTSTGNVTITGTGIATATQTSANFNAN